MEVFRERERGRVCGEDAGQGHQFTRVYHGHIMSGVIRLLLMILVDRALGEVG